MKKIMGVCMAVLLLLCGCGDAQTAQAPELIHAVGVKMDTAPVVKMDLSGVTAFSAQIVPSVEELAFMTSGSIESLRVSIGDKVKKGQLLATLSGTSGKAKSLRAEIDGMKAQNDDINKQSQYDIEMLRENVKDLRKQLGSQKKKSLKKNLEMQIETVKMDIRIAEEKLRQQKEMQQLEIRQKERELTQAQSGAKNSKLYSTIDGEVIGTTGGSGYLVQGGNTAIQVANMKKPRLKTTFVSASSLAKASSCVAVIDGKKYEIEAEEQEISREDIERGKTPENTWFHFVDDEVSVQVGKSAAVELYTDSVKDALVVPANAVFGSGEEKYVYLIESGAKIKTNVTVGTKTDAYIQIVTGVKEGDVVYVES